jgi:putative ABC transport system permease protein
LVDEYIEGAELAVDTIASPAAQVARSTSGPRIGAPIPLHLALKEVWRNKQRFAAIGIVVALITLLVLFTAGLAEGLGLGNREYLENVGAELVVYQDTSELLIPSSRISEATLRDVRLVEGVETAGGAAFSSVAIALPDGRAPVRVSLAGVEPGQPGEPPVTEGRQLDFKRGMEAIIDVGVAARTGLKLGDKMTIQSVLDDNIETYELDVVGITRSNQYSIQPLVAVPALTWNKVRPRVSTAAPADPDAPVSVNYNVAFVRLNNPADAQAMARQIQRQVEDVRVVDRTTAWENTPGYSAQQSTLTLQRVFTLLIAVLVVGSFFRVQALQKVAQVGVLKAIGTPNRMIAFAALAQIFFVNALGVAFGALLTFGLTLFIPPVVPIRFDGTSVALAVALLLVVGPLGALESVRFLLKVEPLKALGLAS